MFNSMVIIAPVLLCIRPYGSRSSFLAFGSRFIILQHWSLHWLSLCLLSSVFFFLSIFLNPGSFLTWPPMLIRATVHAASRLAFPASSFLLPASHLPRSRKVSSALFMTREWCMALPYVIFYEYITFRWLWVEMISHW